MLEVAPEGFSTTSTLEPWDSLCVVLTLNLIDEQFGKIVDGGALSKCVTAGDVLKIAEGV